MSSRYSMLAVIVAGTIAIGSAAHALEAPGSIKGRLLNDEGDVISGLEATVSMKNVATGTVATAPVSREGTFSVSGLAPGTYDLILPIPCCLYSSFEKKGVAVGAGMSLELDLPIAIGINLGTIGDDPGMLSNDMRKRAGDVSGPTPRMPDGKPDLSGVWYTVPATRSQMAAKPPMKAWAAEMNSQLDKINTQMSGAFCLPSSATPTTVGFPYKFVQTPTLMVHLIEFDTPGYRQIFLDGRPHPPANEWNPAWMGHSVGHWEGDTLVIDTVGFNEVTPGFGVHTEKLHVVERIRRPERGRLEIEITATDSDAWTGEWKRNLVAGLVPNDEILEFVCAENNVDPLHFGGLGWKGRP